MSLKRQRVNGFAALFGLVVAFAPGPCSGQATIVLRGGFVSDIDSSSNVDFTLQFSRAPDFSHSDGYGRQADAFQFYIATTTNVPVNYPPRPYASLIRGGEIHFGGGIIVRNDGPSDDTDPHSGGWGSVRGDVPYTLSADTLMFSVPADVLDVRGPFAYSLLLTSYGASTHDPYTGESGFPISVPEPGAAALLFTALLTGFLMRKPR